MKSIIVKTLHFPESLIKEIHENFIDTKKYKNFTAAIIGIISNAVEEEKQKERF